MLGVDFMLHGAVSAGNIDEVKTLLAQGVDNNTKGYLGKTALFICVHYDKVECVRTLINSGANVNTGTEYGVTPLMQAAGNAQECIIGLLVAAGADLDIRTPCGGSAVHFEVIRSHWDIVQALLLAGAALTHDDMSILPKGEPRSVRESMVWILAALTTIVAWVGPKYCPPSLLHIATTNIRRTRASFFP